jgi:phosphate butyryltransferase
MPFTRLDSLIEAAAAHPTRRVAVAAAHDRTVLEALKEARARRMAEPVLFGRAGEIERLAAEIGLLIPPDALFDEPDDAVAAVRAAEYVRDGRADLLMKGHVHTDDFLRGVLDRERGLRTGLLMSHVFVMELIHEERLLLVTDAAMNIAPTLEQKAEIALNAIYLAELLGIHAPRVAALGAVELVNPAMPATVDAAALATMARRGQFPRGIVDGPFGLDNAVSEAAARQKRISGDVAGRADILVVPEIESGNILAKSFVFLAGGRVAGVVAGAAAPVVLTSRADSADAKLNSIALAVLMANLKRDQRLKIGRVHY